MELYKGLEEVYEGEGHNERLIFAVAKRAFWKKIYYRNSEASQNKNKCLLAHAFVA